MQVLVFGTSNSVMQRGWVNSVLDQAAGQGICMANHSIGGASSRLGAWLTASHEGVASADVIVYDFAVPDRMFLQAGWLTLDDILGQYLSILRDLMRRDALHKALFLLFPQSDDMAQSPMLDRIAALLHDFGAGFVDFRPVLAALISAKGLAPEQVFLDPRHYTPEVQHHIGRHVLALLPGLGRRQPPSAAAARLAALPVAGYRRLQLAPQSVTVEKGTRLVRFPTVELREGDERRLSGAKYLTGVLFWAHANSGSLTCHGGQGAIRMHLRRSFRDMFLFDSLSASLPIGPGARLRVGDDAAAANQRGLGLVDTHYDQSGATCDLVLLLGCDIPPADYLALFEHGAAAPVPRRQPAPWLSALRRPWRLFWA